eukprot:157414_1
MRIILITSILTCVFGAWFDGPKCTYQTASFELSNTDGNIIDYGGIVWNPAIGCWSDQFSCGSTRFEGTFIKKWKALFSTNTYEQTFTYSTEAKRCVANNACYKLAGGENNCEYAEYTYQKWRPQSCDTTADFDAITEDHDVKLYFTCCNDPQLYCNQNIDYSADTCIKSDSFTAYMKELNICWNDFKYDFMKDLLCDNERGDILTYSDQCTNNDGSYRVDRRTRLQNTLANTNCTYRATCADELRSKLTEYGSCACKAASDNGYTGEFIGAAMEVNWNRFCPGIEIECAADGIIKLLYKYWRARYKFRVAVANITEAIRTKIKEKIAERLNVASDRIEITEDDDTVTRRRRILQDSSEWKIEIQSDDKSSTTYYQNQLTLNKIAIATDIADELNGVTVDNTVVDTEEAE